MTAAQAASILILDDHPLVGAGLASVLRTQPDIASVLQCPTVAEATALLRREAVDLVLADYNLGPETAIGFVPLAREAGFLGPVIVLTGSITIEAAARLLEEGACGILLKTTPIPDLCHAIRLALKGDRITAALGPAHGKPDCQAHKPIVLTEREDQVLQRVMRGMMTKEIAFELRVSEPSVKGTIQQLFTKTGTRSRVQLVRFAFDHYLGRAAGDYAGTVNHV